METTSPGSRRQRPPLRVKLLLLCCSLGLLVVLEVLLRLVGVASEDPFQGFGEGASCLEAVQLPDGRAVWQVREGRCPEPFNCVAFDQEKAPALRRIFVLGGSAAYGYPRDHRTAFSRWLEDRLRLELPDTPVEVINLGAMSYGSERLLGVARQCVQAGGDLLVVATGNNEYVERRIRRDVRPVTGLRRTLNHLALYRGLRSLVQRIAPPPRASQPLEARDQVLRDVMPRTPALDREVVQAFEEHLSALVTAAREAGVPVLLSNVPTNLATWPPQESRPGGTLSETQGQRWRELLEEGHRLLALGDPHAALDRYRKALELDDQHAELHFRAGQACIATGQLREARAHLVAARDLDRRPIRATTAILEATARVAQRLEVPLANTDAAFAVAATGGIPGNDLLVDYCHPTLDGHRLWARMVARAMREHGLLAPTAAWQEAEEAVLAAERAVMQDPPTDTNLEAQEAFARGTLAVRDGEYEEALAHFTRVIELNPSNYDAYYNRGLQHHRLDQLREALADYQRAVGLRPDHYQALGNAGSVLIELGEPAAALEVLEAALSISPDYVRALVNSGRACELLGRTEHALDFLDRALRLEPTDVNARLIRGMVRMGHGQIDGARSDLGAVLQADPTHQMARDLLQQLPP